MLALLVFYLTSADLERDLLQDRLKTYDVFYKITLSINLRTLPPNSENDPVYARPLRVGEEPAVMIHHYRCRKQDDIVRLEEFIDGRVKTVAVLAQGNLQVYSPFNHTLDIVGHSSDYYMQHCAYDNFRFLVFHSTTLTEIVRRRRAKGIQVELLPGPIMRIGPGDNSNLQLSSQEIEAIFDPNHALTLRQLTFFFPGTKDPQVRREISRFKQVDDGLFVPLEGRIFVFNPSPEFGGKPSNEYYMVVDESRSHWNIPMDDKELRELKLAAGTRVIDVPNQRSFIVGETSVPKNLDKLAEQATEVLFGSIEPKPETYNWVLLAGGAAALLFLIALGFYLSRRGRYA